MAIQKFLTLVSGTFRLKSANDSSAGSGDAGKIVALDSNGLLATNMIPDYSNLAMINAGNSWSTAQLPATAGTIDLGSTSLPFRNLYVRGAGANYMQITTASLNGNRVFTLPNANCNPVQPSTAVANQFITGIDANGLISRAQPSSADLSDSSNLPLLNATNTFTANNTFRHIFPQTAATYSLGTSSLPWQNLYLRTSGTNYISIGTAALSGVRAFTLPNADCNPIQPSTAVANQYMTGIDSNGLISRAQPASADLSDSSNLPLINAANVFTNNNNTFRNLLPAAAASYSLGSTTLPWQNIYLRNSGSNYMIFTTAALTGNRGFTLPNANCNPVQPATGSAGQFVTGIDSSGVLSFDTPSAPTVLVGNCFDGRLTLSSNTPVTTSDVTGASLYYTSYKGNKLSHWNGTSEEIHTFSQITRSLSGLTANTNYDAFVYDSNSDGIDDTIDLVAWTNNTTRAIAISYQNGIPTKTGATSRTYVGTIRITATTGQCADSLAFRYVWNCFNRVVRPLSSINTATSYAYSTKTWRQFNGGTGAIQLNLVVGLAEDAITVGATAFFGTSNANRGAYVGIGVNSTSTNSAQLTGNNTLNQLAPQSIRADYTGIPSLGLNNIYPLEAGNGSTTTTFYGTGNDSFASPGITATYPM